MGPWPYPEDGAEEWLHRVLRLVEDHSRGAELVWAIGLREDEDEFVGVISVRSGEVPSGHRGL